MDIRRIARPAALAATAATASFALVAAAGTAGAAPAGPPPPPTAANGHVVTVLGSGIPTPTAFAFAGRTVFAGSGPDESPARRAGGLFTVAGGRATRVPGTPPVVFGLAWRSGTLYLSAGRQLIAYRGWNGRRFASARPIFVARRGFAGLSGLAFGPNGRLYAGAFLNDRFDHSRDPNPLAQSVLSMKPNGSDLKVVARGLRQPFQLTFPAGSRNPFVSDLSAEVRPTPQDEIVVAKPGANFGFPTCTWLTTQTSACRGFTRPLVLLNPHASPMGIGSIGSTLYVSLFGGIDGSGRSPAVVTIPTAGGTPTAFLTGFVAPVIALSVNRGTVYVGDLTGRVYSVQA